MQELEIDYGKAEASAMSAARSLQGHNASWGELVAIAQYALTRATGPSEVQNRWLHPGSTEHNAGNLVAAARILHAAGEQFERADVRASRDFAVLSGLAFGLDGNSPAAATVTRELLNDESLSPALMAIVATCAPWHLPALLPRARNDT